MQSDDYFQKITLNNPVILLYSLHSHTFGNLLYPVAHGSPPHFAFVACVPQILRHVAGVAGNPDDCFT
jgi:hypothetical protein